jgi:hypothetical protein
VRFGGRLWLGTRRGLLGRRSFLARLVWLGLRTLIGSRGAGPLGWCGRRRGGGLGARPGRWLLSGWLVRRLR